MKNKIIYYAHSMKIYGTKRERKELKFLQEKFKTVINPSTDPKLQWNGSMSIYYDAVSESDITVCSEYKKCIGKGVFYEINVALDGGKKVYCMKKDGKSFKLVEVDRVEEYNNYDWSVEYGKVVIKE